MDGVFLAVVVMVVVHLLNQHEARGRIALLGAHLRKHPIEPLMAELCNGYLRAMDTQDPDRRRQIWAVLANAEHELTRQLNQLAADFSQVFGAHTQVSRLPVALPRIRQLFPRACFDLRDLINLHAQGIATLVANPGGLSPRDRAFTLTAEMLLLQHSCHWFCRSQAVASARLVALHQTSYEQVLASVSPETRAAYERVVWGR